MNQNIDSTHTLEEKEAADTASSSSGAPKKSQSRKWAIYGSAALVGALFIALFANGVMNKVALTDRFNDVGIEGMAIRRD